MSLLVATFTTKANAVAFQSAEWDWIRTIHRGQEALAEIWSDDVNDYTDIGGVTTPATRVATTAFSPIYLNGTTYGVLVHSSFVDATKVWSVNGTRSATIAAALESGPTITLKSGVTIVNSFWTTDAATTTTRWTQMVAKMTAAITPDATWQSATQV